jgi:hypothetical protein
MNEGSKKVRQKKKTFFILLHLSFPSQALQGVIKGIAEF